MTCARSRARFQRAPPRALVTPSCCSPRWTARRGSRIADAPTASLPGGGTATSRMRSISMNRAESAAAPLVHDTPTVDSLSGGESVRMAGAAIKLGEIVVFVDGQGDTAGILESAALLAEDHGAHLTGVFMQPLPAATPPEMFARGKGVWDVIDAHRAQLEAIEADHHTLFADTVRRHGIRSEWRSVPYLSGDVEVNARYADLAVVARPDLAGHTASPPGLLESLVLTSGRPVIVLPPYGTVSGIRRILVGWNGEREAVRAVADALPFLVRAE